MILTHLVFFSFFGGARNSDAPPPIPAGTVDYGDGGAPEHKIVHHPGFNRKEAERKRRENEELNRYVAKLYYNIKGLPLPLELQEELAELERNEPIVLSPDQEFLIRSRVYDENLQAQQVELLRLQKALQAKLLALHKRQIAFIEEQNEIAIKFLLEQLL